MGTLYVDTGGSATNSGSTDQNAANLSGAAATVSGSVVTLDGSPDLSGLVTSGAAQSSIYLADASNANMKIFWITAFDDTANTVTVSVAPTGVVSSAWAIGGRQLVVDTALSVCRAGDTCIVNNSPAPVAGTVATFRIAGDATSGPVKLVGKTGVRPVLNTTNTSNCVVSAVAYSWIENLEIDQDGATGDAVAFTGTSWVVQNVRISDAGGHGINATNPGFLALSLITGCGGSGLTTTNRVLAFGNSIGTNTGDGITISGTVGVSVLENNIINTNSGRGVYQSSAAITTSQFVIQGNTIVNNGAGGIEFVDADCQISLFNNIFYENGNAAGEFNVEIPTASGLFCVHGNNLFYSSGIGGAGNLSGLTANSTESTADPLFVNFAGANLSLQPGSPARATGYPGALIGGINQGYADMGALQRQEAAARVIGS